MKSFEGIRIKNVEVEQMVAKGGGEMERGRVSGRREDFAPSWIWLCLADDEDRRSPFRQEIPMTP